MRVRLYTHTDEYKHTDAMRVSHTHMGYTNK